MTLIENRMTLADFLAQPEEKPALEYEDGMVTQKVSPKGQHSALQFDVAALVNSITRPGKVARAFTELRATFAGMSRVPDVSVYAWERIPRDANGELLDDFTEPPDIAIEIRSPGQRTNRLLRRCQTLVANGVQAAVLIDPADRSIMVIRGGVALTILTAGETLDLSDIIPAVRVAVDAVFDALKV